MKKRKHLAGYFFIAPQLVGLSLFIILPILAGLVLATLDWDMLGDPKFVGLGNFAAIMKDRTFWRTIWNTLYFALGTVPTGAVLGLLLALALNQPLPGIRLFRAAFFIPVITSWSVAAIVWRWLYNPSFGLINSALSYVGIQGPAWLSLPQTAMPALIMTTIWKFLGYNAVIYLAGLQGIPKETYEAAEIDGASAWHKLVRITIPLLSPVTFFVLIISFIGGFQAFAQVYLMTKGGPADATNVLIYYIYQNAFQWFRMGYAGALSWVLFMIILAVTIFQWRMQARWVHYDR